MSIIDEKAVIELAPQKLWERLVDPSSFVDSFSPDYKFHYQVLPASFTHEAAIDFELSRWYVAEKWRVLSCVDSEALELELVQQKGPFKKWKLSAKIESHGEGKSLLTEHLEYKMPYSVIGSIVDDLFLRRDLRQQLRRHQEFLGI